VVGAILGGIFGSQANSSPRRSPAVKDKAATFSDGTIPFLGPTGTTTLEKEVLTSLNKKTTGSNDNATDIKAEPTQSSTASSPSSPGIVSVSAGSRRQSQCDSTVTYPLIPFFLVVAGLLVRFNRSWLSFQDIWDCHWRSR